MHAASLLIGPFLMMVGWVVLILLYSTVELPIVEGWMYWWDAIRGMWRFSAAATAVGMMLFLFGAAFFAGGAVGAIGSLRRKRA